MHTSDTHTPGLSSIRQSRPLAFDRPNFYQEDGSLKPQAIFPEDASAEGGDEFNDSSDEKESLESEQESRNNKTVQSINAIESPKKPRNEPPESKGSDESTQEREFDWDLEEHESEEILEEGEVDSDNFIADTDEESDEDEDYESESDEDEDLEFDCFDDGKNQSMGETDKSRSPRKTRFSKGEANVSKGGNSRRPIDQDERCKETEEKYPPGQSHDLDAETGENEVALSTISAEPDGNQEEMPEAASISQNTSIPRGIYPDSNSSDHMFDPDETDSDTEVEESSVDAIAEIEKDDAGVGEVEVIAQILSDTHFENDEHLVYLSEQDVDQDSRDGKSINHIDMVWLSRDPITTDRSLGDEDLTSREDDDDDDKTIAFEMKSHGQSHNEDESQRDSNGGESCALEEDRSDVATEERTSLGKGIFIVNEAKDGTKAKTEDSMLKACDQLSSLVSIYSCDDVDTKERTLPESQQRVLMKIKSVPHHPETRQEDDRVRKESHYNMDERDNSPDDTSKETDCFYIENPQETAEESFLRMDNGMPVDTITSATAEMSVSGLVREEVVLNDDCLSPVEERKGGSETLLSLQNEMDGELNRNETGVPFSLVHPQSDLEFSKGCSVSVTEHERNTSTSLRTSLKSTQDDPETTKENQMNRMLQRSRRTRGETIRRGKWMLGSKIGTGSFGVVHVGMNTHTGQLIAVKSVELSVAAMKDVRVEVELLQSLSHLHIVRYLGAERVNRTLHIFQEWVPGGSVTTLLSKFGPFSAAVMRSYLSQILTGLAFLHENRILHRDIKGGNVLISDDGIVKLADFGSAKRLAHQAGDMMESLTMRGTPYFMAPEVFEERYNGKADIWSVGCVGFQMATGLPPWKVEGFGNPMSLFLHLRNSEGLPTLNWPESGPMRESEKPAFEKMLLRCFWRTASMRPTAQGLACDPFFSDSSSGEDDVSPEKVLFSPGGDTVSTFTPQTPHASNTPPLVKRPTRSPFMSPPMPRKIGIMNAVNVSPLDRSQKIDTKDWPTWAHHQLKKERSSPTPVQARKMSPLLDSLAYSTDSANCAPNPFGRSTSDSARELSPSLAGLDFADGSDQ